MARSRRFRDPPPPPPYVDLSVRRVRPATVRRRTGALAAPPITATPRPVQPMRRALFAAPLRRGRLTSPPWSQAEAAEAPEWFPFVIVRRPAIPRRVRRARTVNDPPFEVAGVRAGSTPTVAAGRTSTPTVSAGRTSTAAVSAGRTSTSTVTGG